MWLVFALVALLWVRLPSRPCEFDSRQPPYIIVSSQRTLGGPKLFEHPYNKNDKAGHAHSMIIGLRGTEVPCQAGLRSLTR